ncbi:glutamate receptor 2.6 [Actinidia rufa]|uniref:Glutamate receptor 2.6 n=1 Tax=Actinidia rufa TaxID=165716 RepID=A0A7J0GBM0_9ERIC|nr:glutamate receptor 2.6 [Actinidia rufa]
MRGFFSLFFVLFTLSLKMGMTPENTTTTIPVNVGVVLDMGHWTGKMQLSCIRMALSDFYEYSHGHYKTRLVLKTRDSKDDVVGAAAAALDLLKNVEARAILGPVTSMQASFVIHLGNKAQVPIISFSATSPSLSPIQNPYFVRAVQNDASQVRAISSIVQAFGWTQVVPIYVDNEFGEGIMPFLADALQEIKARIPYRSAIPPSPTDEQIFGELNKLVTMKTRVFVVHMFPSLASRLFTIVKKVGMMSEGYAWILTDTVTNGLSSMDPLVIDSMQGVMGVMPYIPRTKQLENFKTRWKTRFQQENPAILNAELDVFGLRAYDAATALAMAVEKVDAPSTGFQMTNSLENSTDLEAFGSSRMGPKLLQALLNTTTFGGLGGDFQIVDGDLRSSGYEIVNVIGNGRNVIGFWTPQEGIVRELNGTSPTTYSTSKASLGSIIWPGDTTTPPKGWELATERKKLRIGVPVKEGFFWNFPSYYARLISEVYWGNFEAVVGDITLLANRTNYVDFTLPYTESGISLVVKIRDNKRKNAWVFLKPLTWDLWLTSFSSFVFVGFAVWVLEHRINEDFRGPPSHQAGTIFVFIFSTMVFAHSNISSLS